MKWQITGANRTTGAHVRGEVEAPDRETAIAVAGRKGITVERAEPRPAPAPPREAPPREPLPLPAVPAEPAAVPEAPPRAVRSLSWLPVALAGLAVLLSSAALVVALTRPGLPGRGVDAYSFDTPEKSLRSNMMAEAEGDIRAKVEFQRRAAGATAEAKRKEADSLQVARTVEHEGKVAAFASHMERGLKKQYVRWLERLPNGDYHPAYMSTFGWEEQPGDKGRIGKMILRWESGGTLE